MAAVLTPAFTAVCDIWNLRREAAAKLVRESYAVEPKVFGRFEDVLADKHIDAVIIATPDHQHAKMLQASVEAGKDVYCEKPMGNVLGETNAALDTAKPMQLSSYLLDTTLRTLEVEDAWRVSGEGSGRPEALTPGPDPRGVGSF
jgi:predicted dehydrogenase